MCANTQILEQAIRSNDASLMTFILERTDKSEVMAQVAALQAASVVPFLRAFSQHIERFPGALRDALPWIEALITARRGDISASPECRRRVAELQNTLRQRTQQIGIFSEASALSNSVKREKEGSGIGLEVVDTFCQDFVEENL